MSSYNSIVGIDCSLTNTGLAAIRRGNGSWVNSGVYGTHIVTKKFTDPLRQVATLGVVSGFIKLYKPDAVVIEDYAFGQRGGKASTRAELVGMIKHLVLVQFATPVYLV